MAYDYTVNVESPLQALGQGVQLGSGLAQIAMQRQQQELAMQQQMRQQQFLQAFMQKPNKTAQDYSQATMMIPGLKDQFKQSWEILNTAQQETAKKEAGAVFSAINSGRIDYAKQLLTNKVTALENSGADPSEIRAAKTMLQSIDIDPSMALNQTGLYLSSLPGGDKLIEAFTKIGGERREQEMAPFAATEKQATAIIKRLEASFAPKKMAVELGIKEEELAKLRREGKGIIPDEKRPDFESKLRKEYSDQTKGYQDVKAAFGRIQSADQTAAGDLALIFNYMKMLDPGSVVREGEFATAQNAAGVPDRVWNLYNRLLSGERLNESQRKSFIGQAERLYKTAGQQEDTVRKGLTRIATGYGIDPANIFYEPKETPPSPVTAQEAQQIPSADQVNSLLQKYGAR